MPTARAAHSTVVEAEAFVLALMDGARLRGRAQAGGSGRRPFRGDADRDRQAAWGRWRGFALGGLNWTEDAFWQCSWRGFADAWSGYSRFVLGTDPDDTEMTRAEAQALDAELRAWQQS